MLTDAPSRRYAPRAGAKSSAGCASPKTHRRTSAPNDGAFFMPVNYGGLCVGGFGLPGSFVSGLAHLRTVRHPSCASDLADSKHKGDPPMTASIRLSNLITRSLSSRAAAHKALAKAALYADSSTRTRLKRYNHHIEKAQQLEAQALETAKRSVGVVS
tara:strand:+ start:41442 stop:41915 length:474 start_codon:yes stop_codon:yes gene_type:complete